jgi:hypothetical protein
MEFQNNSALSSLSNLNKYSAKNNEIILSNETSLSSTVPFQPSSSSLLSTPTQSRSQPNSNNNASLQNYLNNNHIKNLSKTDAIITNSKNNSMSIKSNRDTPINDNKPLKNYQIQQKQSEIAKLINSKTSINEQDLNTSVSPLSNASSSDISSTSSTSNSMLFNQTQSLTYLDNDDFSITNHSQSPPVVVRQVANVRERQVSIFIRGS